MLYFLLEYFSVLKSTANHSTHFIWRGKAIQINKNTHQMIDLHWDYGLAAHIM